MSRRFPEIATAFLIVGSLVLRWRGLGKQSIEMDEAYSLWVSSHSISTIVQILKLNDTHPPLFYFFLHYWQKLGYHEFLLRFPFALFGGLNTLLVILVARKFADQKSALLSGFLWATSFWAFQTETWVRMYAMMVTWTLLSTLCFLRAKAKPSAFSWGLYIVAAALSTYTQYLAFFIVLAHMADLAIGKRLKEALLIASGILALFSPWFVAFYHQAHSNILVKIPPGPWHDVLLMFSDVLAGRYFLANGLGVAVIVVIGVFCVGQGILKTMKNGQSEPTFLLLLFFVPYFFSFFFDHAGTRHITSLRSIIVFTPYFLILFSIGILSLHKVVYVPVLVALTFINLCLMHLFVTNPAYERENWRAACQLLRENVVARDAILVEQPMACYPIQYYIPQAFNIIWNSKNSPPMFLDLKGPVLWQGVDDALDTETLKQIDSSSLNLWLVFCQSKTVDPNNKILFWSLKKRVHPLIYRYHSMDPGNEIWIYRFKRP